MKRTLTIPVVISILMLAAIGTAQPVTPPATPPQAKSIRDVDFKNFTYPTLPERAENFPGCDDCTKPGEIKLVNGKTKTAKLVALTFEDVTGNAAEEAFIELYEEDEASEEEGGGREAQEMRVHRHFYLYALRDGRPGLVWQEGSVNYVNSASAGKRSLVVEGGDGKGNTSRFTYAGTDDGKLKLVKKEKVKPGAPAKAKAKPKKGRR